MERKKPKVLVSRCLTFENCRYDGGIVNDDFINDLKPHVEFETVCPEVEIGLGVPRQWLSLVKDGDEFILYQRATGLDFTEDIEDYADEVFKKHPDADGFILKGRSPSCGIGDVKFYPSKDNKIQGGKATGIFGELVLSHYRNYPVESEGRLRNFTIRESFLTKLYTLFRFRAVQESMKMKDLVRFQAQHKFLLQSYSENGMRKLGRICANHDQLTVQKVIDLYFDALLEVFNEEQKFTKNINILDHCFGFVSDHLKDAEKKYYFDIIKQYRNGKLPLSVPISIIRSWAIKHEVEYLLEQYYFDPYPMELVDISDSGKGRDF
jgi:uncharacterized protein YbgA (DUF1722 family)/uncharacterized protein YbbK (DUF523 family)